MAIVAFWSNRKEETSKTVSVVASAVMTAIDNNLKVLLLSTANDDNTLETCFWNVSKLQKSIQEITNTKSSNVLESGINALVQLVNSNKLYPEIVTDYTKMVFKNRLEVLFGGTIKSKEDYTRISKYYKDIISIANKHYDIVFVDLNKGLSEEMVNEILNISDLTVINISQSLAMIDDYMRFSMENLQFDMKKSILVIGRYDAASKYNIKNITRYIQAKQGVYAVPYNTLFSEAINEGNVANFFLKYRKISETNENFKFIQEIRKLSSAIIGKLQL